MKILEYEQVDNLDVLHLNLKCLDFALTKERATQIILEDPRSFPFLCLYGEVDQVVAGQVGVLRLPVVSTQGAGEVGGVWGVSTHPAYTRQGIAHRLLEEGHSRMRSAGLSFSTLITNRYWNAYRLFTKVGYQSLFTSASVIARRASLPGRSRLRAERAGREGLALADTLFTQIAGTYLGFARRHRPFFPLLERRQFLEGKDLWLFWDGDEPKGYAVAYCSASILRLSNLLLFDGVDPLSAVDTLANEFAASYIQITVDRQDCLPLYMQAGFRVVEEAWRTFMVKPLEEGISMNDFRSLYGLASNRFLISCLDLNYPVSDR